MVVRLGFITLSRVSVFLRFCLLRDGSAVLATGSNDSVNIHEVSLRQCRVQCSSRYIFTSESGQRMFDDACVEIMLIFA